MLNRTLVTLALLLGAAGSSAVQAAPSEQERRAALAAPLADQRNTALNNLALCQADFGFLQQELEAARKQIEELRAQVPEKAPSPEK